MNSNSCISNFYNIQPVYFKATKEIEMTSVIIYFNKI